MLPFQSPLRAAPRSPGGDWSLDIVFLDIGDCINFGWKCDSGLSCSAPTHRGAAAKDAKECTKCGGKGALRKTAKT